MSFLDKRHPWNPQYAIPGSVLNEPPRRGTFTSAGRSRRSADFPQRYSTWKSGYALPDYVEAETQGAEVYRTKYLPRRTIGVSPSALGSDEVGPGQAGDPITEFGHKTANYLVRSMKTLPAGQRRFALNALLAQLEPGLPARVRAAEAEARNQGLDADAALRAAIAGETAKGFLQQIVETGQRGAVKTRSMPGLVAKPAQAQKVVLSGAMQAMGGIGDFFKGAGSWLGKAGKTIGQFGCSAMQNPLGQASAAAGGAAIGGQTGAAAGMVGSQIIGAACAKPQGGGQMGPYMPPQRRSPIGPIVLGVGTLAAVLLLTK